MEELLVGVINIRSSDKYWNSYQNLKFETGSEYSSEFYNYQSILKVNKLSISLGLSSLYDTDGYQENSNFEEIQLIFI